MSDGGSSLGDVGRRLMALREALGHKQGSFAELIGVSQPAVNNYEAGIRRPDIEVAIRIAIKTGVTLDWLYRGERQGLPGRLLELLPDMSDTRRKAG